MLALPVVRKTGESSVIATIETGEDQHRTEPDHAERDPQEPEVAVLPIVGGIARLVAASAARPSDPVVGERRDPASARASFPPTLAKLVIVASPRYGSPRRRHDGDVGL